jgi:hypothetical protein
MAFLGLSSLCYGSCVGVVTVCVAMLDVQFCFMWRPTARHALIGFLWWRRDDRRCDARRRFSSFASCVVPKLACVLGSCGGVVTAGVATLASVLQFCVQWRSKASPRLGFCGVVVTTCLDARCWFSNFASCGVRRLFYVLLDFLWRRRHAWRRFPVFRPSPSHCSSALCWCSVGVATLGAGQRLK